MKELDKVNQRSAALEAQLAAMRAGGEPVACHKKANDYCRCSRKAMLCDGVGPAHHQPAAQDAELYQFIRNCSMEDRNKLEHYSKDALDKAIRAAIAAQQGEKT